MEGGKPEYPKKNPRSRDENQQQSDIMNVLCLKTEGITIRGSRF